MAVIFWFEVVTSGRLGPNFEPLIVTVPKAALVRSAASVTLGSQRPFAASRMNVRSTMTASSNTDRHA